MTLFTFYKHAALEAYGIEFEDITSALKEELAADRHGELLNERGRDAFVKKFFQDYRRAVGGLYIEKEVETLASIDLIVAAYVEGFDEGTDVPN